MKQRIALSCCLLMMFFLYAGCSSTTSPGTTTVVVPKQGSIFIAYHSAKDSTGNIISSDTEKQTVTMTGLTIYGKTNVIALVQNQNGGTADTTYYHYEDNGDLSAASSSSSLWITAPFGSQSTLVKRSDTTVQGTHYVTNITAKGAGAGSVSIKGNTFSTQKVSFIVTDSVQSTGHVLSSGILNFAPALGFIVIEDDAATRDSFSGALGLASHTQVVDYTLY